MEYVRFSKKNSICSLLIEFLEVFPHLEEKISSIDEYAQKLSELAFVYSAKENLENEGILIFYANDCESKTAYISLIGVKKRNERKGIGRALLEYCEEESRKYGMCKVKLEVDADNTKAIDFYERNGFSFLNATERKSFYMQKDI